MVEKNSKSSQVGSKIKPSEFKNQPKSSQVGSKINQNRTKIWIEFSTRRPWLVPVPLPARVEELRYECGGRRDVCQCARAAIVLRNCGTPAGCKHSLRPPLCRFSSCRGSGRMATNPPLAVRIAAWGGSQKAARWPRQPTTINGASAGGNAVHFSKFARVFLFGRKRQQHP